MKVECESRHYYNRVICSQDSKSHNQDAYHQVFVYHILNNVQKQSQRSSLRRSGNSTTHRSKTLVPRLGASLTPFRGLVKHHRPETLSSMLLCSGNPCCQAHSLEPVLSMCEEMFHSTRTVPFMASSFASSVFCTLSPNTDNLER